MGKDGGQVNNARGSVPYTSPPEALPLVEVFADSTPTWTKVRLPSPFKLITTRTWVRCGARNGVPSSVRTGSGRKAPSLLRFSPLGHGFGIQACLCVQ